jgi:hypothetical protein
MLTSQNRNSFALVHQISQFQPRCLMAARAEIEIALLAFFEWAA